MFGKKDEKKFTNFDQVINYLRDQKVDDFLILSQLVAAMNDVIDDIVESKDYNLLVATESHIEKILLAKLKNAISDLEKSKNGRRK